MPDLGTLSDHELIIRLQQGDCNAFTQIYQKYWQGLYNAAYKRNHDKEQCQDIVQNIFTDLWNRRAALSIENLPAFLHTAVRFQVFKKAARQPLQSLLLDSFEDIITSPLHTDDMVLEKEVLALIQLWIDALPKKRREIFLLHYTQDLSTKEISGLLDISQKTVQNQLHTASQGLRNRLAHFLSLSVIVAFMVN